MMHRIGLLYFCLKPWGVWCEVWTQVLVIKWDCQEISAQLQSCVWCIISILGPHIVSWLFIFDKSSGFLHYVTSGAGRGWWWWPRHQTIRATPESQTDSTQHTNVSLNSWHWKDVKHTRFNGSTFSKRSDTMKLMLHFIDIFANCPPRIISESGQVSLRVSARDSSQAIFHCSSANICQNTIRLIFHRKYLRRTYFPFI